MSYTSNAFPTPIVDITLCNNLIYEASNINFYSGLPNGLNSMVWNSNGIGGVVVTPIANMIYNGSNVTVNEVCQPVTSSASGVFTISNFNPSTGISYTPNAVIDCQITPKYATPISVALSNIGASNKVITGTTNTGSVLLLGNVTFNAAANVPLFTRTTGF